jgi:hypothetical protein
MRLHPVSAQEMHQMMTYELGLARRWPKSHQSAPLHIHFHASMDGGMPSSFEVRANFVHTKGNLPSASITLRQQVVTSTLDHRLFVRGQLASSTMGGGHGAKTLLARFLPTEVALMPWVAQIM